MNNLKNSSQTGVFFLIYASAATTHFSTDQLLVLLDKCRQNNTRLGITGMLLYKDGNFIQMLEGDEQIVRQLYDKISVDSRHLGIVTFLQGFEPQRQFPDWSMGFHDLNLAEKLEVPGYNEFMKTKFTSEEFSANPTRAQKLLLSFKKTM